MPNFQKKNFEKVLNAGFLSARIGEWLFTVALNWAVYTQTESPLLLAVINACRLLPTLFFSVPAGYLADRFDRSRLNLIATALQALLTLAVGLSLALESPFGICALLVVFRASVSASEGTFRNAYLCDIFSGVRLKSVVAQNASVMNLGRIIGPVLGGVLLAKGGSLLTFVAASLCFSAYTIALSSLPQLPSSQKKSKEISKKNFSFRETLQSNPELRKLLLLAVPIMFFGFPFTAMLPLITESLLQLGSEEFGSLLAISATGALLASSQLSLKASSSDWAKTKNFAFAFALSLLGLAFVHSYLSTALVLFVIGYFGQAYRTSSRMLFQELVPKERAGKMLGLALMDRGMIPLGGLLIGMIAETGEIRLGLSVMGVGCLLSLMVFFTPEKRALRSSTFALSLAALISTLISGCHTESTPAGIAGPSLTIEHAWGNTPVPLQPQRIVVLDLPFLDACTALEQTVVGFAGTSDQNIPGYLTGQLPPGEAPRFVGERKQPNLEIIYKLKPDLIIANPDRHKLIRSQLESVAPTIAFTDNSFQEITSMTQTLANITQREHHFDSLSRQLEESLKKARSQQKKSSSVLVVGAFEDEFSTWTAGSFVGTLFQEIGADYSFKGQPTASESQTEVAKITIETLAQLNPDSLFVYGDPSSWSGNKIYRALKANQNQRIMSVSRDLWSRARGPLAALEILEAYSNFLASTKNTAMHTETQ